MIIVRVGLLGGLATVLSGCLLPPAVMIGAYVADGVVLLASGKTTKDHALSSVKQQDCALFRVVQSKDICVDYENVEGGPILTAAGYAGPDADDPLANAAALDVRIAKDDTAAMLLAQTYLTSLGYDAGPIDGVIGTRTRVATMAYQGTQGIEQTGYLTYAGLSDLGEVALADHADTTPSETLAGKEPVVIVQAHLAYFGYEPGPLDGSIGPATLAALSAYQIDRGMAPHAAVTPALLAHMQDHVDTTHVDLVTEASVAPTADIPPDAG